MSAELDGAEHPVALRLEAWSKLRTAEAMTDLAARFLRLGTDAKLLALAAGKGSLEHAARSAELDAYRRAWRMCRAEADALEKESHALEARAAE